jgi:protein-disulfide isomerase
MPTLIRTALAALAMLAAALPVRAESFSADQKEEIGQIVRDYLLANPEVLEDAINVLRERRDKEASEASAQAVEDKGEAIFNSKNQIVLGNPDGPITLVEFFDYNCTYCKRAVSDMTALIDANPDLRMVLKEFPILTDGSLEAARIAAAVQKLAPESYLAFHVELFSRPGQADAAKALEVASDVGLDADAVKKAAEDPAITANISEVHDLAVALGITGTPSYVIGKEVVAGAIGFDALQEKVTAMRQCGATVC